MGNEFQPPLLVLFMRFHTQLGPHTVVQIHLSLKIKSLDHFVIALLL